MENHRTPGGRSRRQRSRYSLALLVVFLLVVALRLVRLDEPFSQGRDEGAYLMTARLIAAGRRPFTEIYMPQLPLFLQSLAFAFRLFGDSVTVGRLVIVAYSGVGLLATCLCARMLSNRAGALAALFILGINPGYTTYSRVVYLEVPGIAVAMLSLCCVLVAPGARRRSWLALAGALWGCAVLIKPFVLGLAPALFLYPALVRRELSSGQGPPGRARPFLLDGLALGLAALVPVVYFLATTDLAAFHHQFLAVNVRLIPESLGEVLEPMSRFLKRDSGMLALALFGAAATLKPAADSTFPLVLAVLGTLAFVVQVPHFNHHAVVLIPPLATLAGVGVGTLWRWLSELDRAHPIRWLWRARALALLGLLAVGVYVVRLPFIVHFSYLQLTAPPDTRATSCVRLVRRWSRDANFVVSDQAMLVYRAGRLIPPGVAISGGADVLAEGITTPTLVQAVRDYRVPLIVASGPYHQLDEWIEWVQAHSRRVATCRETRTGELIELYRVNE